MALADATALPGEDPLPTLPAGGAPYPAAELLDWRGRGFMLPPGDPRLAGILRGAEATSGPHDNLVGAGKYWLESPEWMDFLDPEAPNHADKLLERSLYLARWVPHLQSLGPKRVLDLGGGIGRFTTWLLDQGLDVDLVDPDLRSLWRAVTSSAGRPGRLDVHWSTGEQLPDLPQVDAVIATEVLCYVEDPAVVLANIMRVLRPGGLLLCSVEARWGWALAEDCHYDTIEQYLGDDGIVHVPGDRWVQTYEGEQFQELLEQAGLRVEAMVPSHYVLSGAFEQSAAPLQGIDHVLELEARLAAHPVTGRLNRAWMAVARKEE